MALPEKFLSVDVECVATGYSHNERAMGHVAVVDQDESVVYQQYVKPDQRVVCYLTPLTGIGAGQLDEGVSQESVEREARALLGPDVVLVGQRIDCDIKWLHLQQGRDYAGIIDLAEVFKAYNRRYGNYSFFSLAHEANILLHSGTISYF